MYSPNWSIGIIVCVGLLCSLSIQLALGMKHSKKVKFCKLDMLLECPIGPNAMFTSQPNGSGIVNSDEEMEQFCFHQVDYVPVCGRQWLKRCGSSTHLEVIDRLFLTPMANMSNVFCDRQGPIRNEFLKYSDCLINKVKLTSSYRKECIRPLQAGAEFIHERSMKSQNVADFIRNSCCAFNKWESCILDHLTIHCGKPSADVFPHLIHQNSLKLLSFCALLYGTIIQMHKSVIHQNLLHQKTTNQRD